MRIENGKPIARKVSGTYKKKKKNKKREKNLTQRERERARGDKASGGGGGKNGLSLGILNYMGRRSFVLLLQLLALRMLRARRSGTAAVENRLDQVVCWRNGLR